MVSHIEIRDLMEAWVNVPTLTPEQKAMVEAFYAVSKKENVLEFVMFKDMMVNQFGDQIMDAIAKARAEGLGVKVH